LLRVASAANFTTVDIVKCVENLLIRKSLDLIILAKIMPW
jgi:hypothetical protein